MIEEEGIVFAADWFGDHVTLHEDNAGCDQGFHIVTFADSRKGSKVILKISCLSRHSMFNRTCPWYDRYAEGLNRRSVRQTS